MHRRTVLCSLTPRRAIELGISTVYQDAELVILTVADNIFWEVIDIKSSF